MTTIYKYTLNPKVTNAFKVPLGSAVLSMQVQKDKPCLWIQVNTEEKNLVEREFIIVGTGHALPEDKPFKYVDTFQMYDGDLIFHVYEIFKY